MFIIKNKIIFLSISAILVLVSLFLIFSKGLKMGIDFTGGSIVNIEYSGDIAKTDNFNINLIKDNLIKNNFEIKDISLLNGNTNEAKIVQIKLNGIIDESRRADFENAWSFNKDKNYNAKQISENTIGPSIGKELTQKAILAIILVIIFIILFIAFSFREVSKPVSSWKYGFITIIALIHDIIIPTGFYAYFDEIKNFEVDSLFVVAILTIIGISISDTIVVFDRIRENLKKRNSNETFEQIVGKSLSQTFMRSINTSLAVIIVLFALFAYGPIAIHGMAFLLLIGIIVGTYSSIFLASPLLVLIEKLSRNKK